MSHFTRRPTKVIQLSNMRVLDHRPQNWFLLESDANLILDVNCNSSFISYSFAMILNADECQKFNEIGVDYLDQLAQEINHSAPVVQEGKSVFKSRKLDEQRMEMINVAIQEWNDKTGG